MTTTPHCQLLNPLQRDGTSQHQRLLDALLPSSVPIDERSLADMLVYAQKYAQLLRYYTNDNTPLGDWRTFIEHDVSVSIALLANSDYAQQKKHFDQHRVNFKKSITALSASNTTIDHMALAELFNAFFSLIQQLDDWLQNSHSGLTLHTDLQRLIQSVLKQAFHQVWEQALNIENVFTDFIIEKPNRVLLSDSWKDLHEPDKADKSDKANEIDEACEPDKPDEPETTTDLPIPSTSDQWLTLLRSLTHNFEQVYKAQVFLVEHADDYLQETLQQYPKHQPHMALLLAFLQLFRYAQQHLNTLSRQHLHFYYEEILQLQRKPAQPDQVHLVFELAKQLDQYRLAKGSTFKAGKDAAGNNLFYANQQDVVLNKAKLSAEHGLKSIFVNIDNDQAISTSTTGTPIQSIHQAAPANSSEDEDGKWHTFGHAKPPDATLGFAIASPMLLLAEGTREITITFKLKSLGSLQSSVTKTIEEHIKAGLQVLLSGEKEWLSASLTKVTIDDGWQQIIPENDQESKPEGKPDKPNDNGKETKPDRFVPRLPDIIGIRKPPRFRVPDKPKDIKRVIKIDNPSVHRIRAIEPANTIKDTLALEKELSIAEKIDSKLKLELELNPAQWKKTQPSITFKLTLNAEDKAVVAYNDAVLQDGFSTSHPVVKFVLTNNKTDGKPYAYNYLNNLIIQSMIIDVDVSNVRNLILENDLGVLNPAKPFHPFGAIPKRGSKFYIGSHEVFQKALQTVTLNITWGDLPTTSFSTHYANYSNTSIDNNVFTADFTLLNNGTWTTLKQAATPPASNSLFKTKKNNTDNAIDPKRSFYYVINHNNSNHPTDLTPFEHYSTDLRYGFMRMALLQSFLHSDYPTDLAAAIVNKATPLSLPNAPYTPLITELKLSYTATEKIDYSNNNNNNNNKQIIEQFFHIAPFGHLEVAPQSMMNLLTDFLVTTQDEQQEQIAAGTLYIGLDQLQPPQNVSILFQVAESSADPTITTPDVHWSYMVNNRWVAFKDTEILADHTHGLLTSGIIRFAMPPSITNNNTLLPNGLHWIKASVSNHTQGIAKLIAVKPQAVAAHFYNQKNDLSHLAAALPAETISKLKQRDSAVKNIHQPFASFDGQLPEGDAAFYRRVSERLRHKGRAITIFDYERLVLEQFPEIYKVKCINHNQYHQGVNNEFSPGSVRLIVVPDLRNKNAIDPLRPKVTVNTLQAIERYLAPLSSDFVNIDVSNPHYEAIKVSFKVAFHQGYDEGFYLNQLEQAIIKFLSPWLYDDVADISFGGRIHRTWILQHIEQQTYVDFVTDFRMDHLLDPESPSGEIQVNVEEAIVQRSSSVLVSHKTHSIKRAKSVVCENSTAE